MKETHEYAKMLNKNSEDGMLLTFVRVQQLVQEFDKDPSFTKHLEKLALDIIDIMPQGAAISFQHNHVVEHRLPAFKEIYDKITGSLKNFVESFKEWFEGIGLSLSGDTFRNMLTFGTLALFYGLTRNKVIGSVLLLYAAWQVWTNSDSIRESWFSVMRKISNCFSQIPEEAIHPQSDVAEDVISAITEVFSICISACVGYQPTHGFVKTITSYLRMTKNPRGHIADVFRNISQFLSGVFAAMNLEDLAAYFDIKGVQKEEVKVLLEKIDNFIISTDNGNIFFEVNISEMLHHLKNDIDSTLSRLEKESPNDHKILSRSKEILLTYERKNQTRIQSLSGARIEPASVLIRGKPGVAKTVLADRLTYAITKLTIPPVWKEDFEKDPVRFRFPMPTDKFYDGYDYMRWVISWDDIYQRREVSGDDSTADSLRTIKVINGEPFMLPFSESSKKNSMFMRSPFVVGTTNWIGEFQDMAVRDASAVARRWHIDVLTRVNAKYLGEDGKVDTTTLARSMVYVYDDRKDLDFDTCHGFESTSFPDDFWVMEVSTWVSNERKNLGVMDIDGVLDLLLERYKTNVRIYYANKVANKSFADKFKDRSVNDMSLWSTVPPKNLQITPDFRRDLNEEQFLLYKRYCKWKDIPMGSDLEREDGMFIIKDYNGENIPLVQALLIEKSRDKIYEYVQMEIVPQGAAPSKAMPGSYPDSPVVFNDEVPSYAQELIECKIPCPYTWTPKLYCENAESLNEFARYWNKKYKKSDQLKISYYFEFTEDMLPTMDEFYMVESYKLMTLLGLDHQLFEELIDNVTRILAYYPTNGLLALGPTYHREIAVSIIKNIFDDEYVRTAFFPDGPGTALEWFNVVEIYLAWAGANRFEVLTQKYFFVPTVWNKAIRNLKRKVISLQGFFKRSNMLGKIVVGLGAISIVGFLIVGITEAVKRLYDCIEDWFSASVKAETQSAHVRTDATSRGPRTVVKLKQTAKLMKPDEIRAQGPRKFTVPILPPVDMDYYAADMNEKDVMKVTMNKYVYTLYRLDYNNAGTKFETTKYGQVLHLKSRIFSMNAHFQIQLDEYYKESMRKNNEVNSLILLVSSDNSRVYQFDIGLFLMGIFTNENLFNNDIVLFINTNVPLTSAGAYRFLPTLNDLSKMQRARNIKSTFITTHLDKFSDSGNAPTKVMIVQKIDAQVLTEGTPKIAVNWSSEYRHYTVNRMLKYSGSFQDGDCGGIVFADTNDYGPRRIIGFHCAGNSSEGYAVTLLQEEVDDVLTILGENEPVFQDETIAKAKDIDPIVVQSGHVVSQIVEQAPTASYKIDITLSAISRYLKNVPCAFSRPKMMPAKIAPFENSKGYFDPYQMALSHYKRSIIGIPEHLLRQASANYVKEWNSRPYHLREKGVLPWKVAIEPFYNCSGIASSTSAGYPMCMSNCPNYKKAYFSAKMMEGIDSKEFESVSENIGEAIEELLAMYRKRHRPTFFYVDNLKCERRPKKKAEEGKTRLFSGSPFLLLILFRMYFGHFVDWFMEHNLNLGSAVGINPYSKDWDRLARRLLRLSAGRLKHIVAGDFSKFDASLLPAILNIILEMINTWYDGTEEETNIRKMLWAEVVNSRHLYKNYVYEWDCSIPSGFYLTIIVNTIYNNIAIRMCWIILGNDIADFKDNVDVVAGGDDNCISVSKYYPNFNQLTISEAMDRIGLTYTTESKALASEPYRSIDEIEFYKRGFVKDAIRNRWVGPLRYADMMEMIHWTKKNHSDTITVDNIGVVYRELSLHPREVFERDTRILLEAMHEVYPGRSPAEAVWSQNYDTMRDYTLQYDAQL